MSAKDEKIVLGSGEIFVTVLEKSKAIPEDAIIEAVENLIGQIQGGASLEYKPEFYTATDDMGKVSKTILTKEEVTLKSGIMTWCGNTFKKLCSTARVTESGSKRIVKIGGANNQDGKTYIIRFVHKDPADGNIRITIVGTNQAGFTMSFAKDKETVIDAEFKAQPMDNDGTLIIYEEDILDPLPPVKSEATNLLSASEAIEPQA